MNSTFGGLQILITQDNSNSHHIFLESRKMTKHLNIVICGGGLGGLSCAIGLHQKGHTVTILDAAKELNEVGAGIQVPPNSVRVLQKYGLLSEIKPIVSVPKGIVLRRYADGNPISTTALDPEMTDMYGYPYWLIHRADYQRVLYEAAVERGIKYIKNCRVLRVDDATVTVHLENGKELSADLIIGGDGIRLVVRDTCVVPEAKISPLPSGRCAYRATVPRDVMLADPKIAHLMTDVNANNWIGPDRHIMAYPMRDGQVYNIVMVHPGEAPVGKWNLPGNLDEMRDHYKNFEPVIKQVLTHVTGCLEWVLADIPSLPRWVSAGGRVCLIGDAAHAMLPFLSQGAAQAVEDGATLAEELEKCESLDDLPEILRHYELLRKARVETIQQGARKHGETWHYEDGPEQEERDRLMRQKGGENPDSWSDTNFQKWLFGWDAFLSTY